MQMHHMILDKDKQLIPATRDAWAAFFQSADRHVGDSVIDGIRVSTVFLGLNHGFERAPEWFETMIFDKDGNSQGCMRCETWAQAEEQHLAFCAEVRRSRLRVVS